jgi:hypothetical protein
VNTSTRGLPGRFLLRQLIRKTQQRIAKAFNLKTDLISYILRKMRVIFPGTANNPGTVNQPVNKHINS